MAAEIEALLEEARRLREGASLHRELAETLNSLGDLKQRRRRYEEAEALHRRSLALRQARNLPCDLPCSLF